LRSAAVDDLRNDSDVTVKFFRIADAMPKSSNGAILPYSSYRLTDAPGYGLPIHGKISDGVLTTEPTDVHLPYYASLAQTGMIIRGLRLQLTLASDSSGAKGLFVGYRDVRDWWDFVQKTSYLQGAGQFSCPALYEAVHRLADGYPDPKTGECTAISAAYRIEAVAGYAIHQAGEKVASGSDTAGKTKIQ